MTQIRLLFCRDCKSVEELPWYSGPPEGDVLLDHLVSKHRFPNGEEHIGTLGDIDSAIWADEARRQDVIKQVLAAAGWPGGGGGLGNEFYATKDTFRDDALACYNAHRRPKDGCIDWKDDRKRVGNPTSAGWKMGAKVYLCDFCPVATYVRTEIRHRKGMYKE